ncbi:hypothetical protein BDZ94DRAFT_1266854 [Collybia nuda]|uniref:Uncharacterized protein n=1 Tax=Collybia nuda TaxID=64659 RepID=A0A9P6CGH2_9AGAR|nr:hypothetical protein BDZ94DRAFT_1266854 [Collybia nuda]
MGSRPLGTANAFITHYTVTVHTVLLHITNDIIAEKKVNSHLETDILSPRFHGKCAKKDPEHPNAPPVDPPGCPNPGRSVVCGAPGPPVHFYSKLRYIAFNSTRKVLKGCTERGEEEV